MSKDPKLWAQSSAMQVIFKPEIAQKIKKATSVWITVVMGSDPT